MKRCLSCQPPSSFTRPHVVSCQPFCPPGRSSLVLIRSFIGPAGVPSVLTIDVFPLFPQILIVTWSAATGSRPSLGAYHSGYATTTTGLSHVVPPGGDLRLFPISLSLFPGERLLTIGPILFFRFRHNSQDTKCCRLGDKNDVLSCCVSWSITGREMNVSADQTKINRLFPFARIFSILFKGIWRDSRDEIPQESMKDVEKTLRIPQLSKQKQEFMNFKSEVKQVTMIVEKIILKFACI